MRRVPGIPVLQHAAFLRSYRETVLLLKQQQIPYFPPSLKMVISTLALAFLSGICLPAPSVPSRKAEHQPAAFLPCPPRAPQLHPDSCLLRPNRIKLRDSFWYLSCQGSRLQCKSPLCPWHEVAPAARAQQQPMLPTSVPKLSLLLQIPAP